MNPYLEQADVWQDFHDSMIPAMRNALMTQIGPDYIVKIEEHPFIHEPSSEQRFRLGHADVSVAHSDPVRPLSAGTAILSSPMIARLPTIEFEKHLFLEFRDRKNRDLITVLEMLSPVNKKPGVDREQYLAKRAHLLRSTAHLVEIDLLRGGPRMPMEEATDCDYAVMVSGVEDRPRVNFWPLRLREPLPPIPIPLRPPHGAVELDLQAVLHGVYDRAHYQNYIYQDAPVPPLSPEDTKWAAALVPT